MRDITSELKELRLHGMASAWADLTDSGTSSTESSKWLIEHLLQAEHTDRAMRSVRHQLTAAKFPVHRDLAGFDFESSKVDERLVRQLATLTFTDTAQNAVLIGGPGTGKTHLATAIAVNGIASNGKRVRFYSTVDLVNVLEQEKREGKPEVVRAEGKAGVWWITDSSNGKDGVSYGLDITRRTRRSSKRDG